MPFLTAALAAMPSGTRALTSSLTAFMRGRLRYRALASLEQLDDRKLRDIGLTRGDLAALRRKL